MKKTISRKEIARRAIFLLKASTIVLHTCDDGVFDWIAVTGIDPFNYGEDGMTDRKVEITEYEAVAKNEKRFKACKKNFRRALHLYSMYIDKDYVNELMS